MNLIQLATPLPLRIVGGPGWAGPTGNCMAVGWFKPHPEHNIVWICFLDDSGQQWEVESPYIRARSNITWGRPSPEKTTQDRGSHLPPGP